jgi:uncharacterized iron-regulated membrane protein
MKVLRKIIFWLHLTAGVFAGVVILIMSVTGAILAFQPQIEWFVELDARTIQAPEDASRLGGRDLLSLVQSAKPDVKMFGRRFARFYRILACFATFTGLGDKTLKKCGFDWRSDC